MPRSPLHKVLSWVGTEKDKAGEAAWTTETAHFRRSSRLIVSVPIILSGHDELGESFDENTRTLEVSKHGAKISTTHRLAAKEEITLSNPAAGVTCQARAVWIGPGRSAQSGYEVGVEVLEASEPERSWAIESPPADWAEGCPSPTADERLEYLCQRARSDHSTAYTPTESATFTDTPAAAKVMVPALETPTLAPELSSDTEPAEPVATHFSADSTDPFGRAALKTSDNGRSARLVSRSKARITSLGLNAGQTGSLVSTPGSTAHVPKPPLEQTVKEAYQPENGSGPSASRSFEAPEASTRSNSDEPDPLSPGVEEAPHAEESVASAPEDPIERILHEAQQKASQEPGVNPPEPREHSAPSVRQRAPVSAESLTADVKAAGQQAVNQVREQLAHMTYKSLEILAQRSKAATEESRKQLAKVFEQAVARSTDTASRTLRRATDQAVTELQSSQQKVQAGFEVRAAEYEKKFEELSTSAAEGLAQQSDALVAAFQSRLDNTLGEFESQAGKRLQEVVDRLTAQFEANWTEQAEKQATAMAAQLSEKLRIAGNAVVDEAKNELGKVTKASLEAVTQATAKECHSQLDRIFREQSELVSGAADAALTSIKLASEQGQGQLRVVRQEMGSSFEASAQQSEKRLGEQTARGMESVERKATSLVEGFESRLGKTLHRFEQTATSELTALLDKTAAQRRAESARQLEIHAVEAERKLKEGLTASGQSVVDEARRLAGITHEALESLSQKAAEECRNQIEEFRNRSLTIQKEVEKLNRTSVERIQEEVAPSKPRKSQGSLVGTLVVLLIFVAPAAFVVYMSTRPMMRLRSDPPAGFAEAGPKWTAKRTAAEEQLAHAYWDSAVQDVQASYHFHETLPVDPPAAFQVDAQVLASSGVKLEAAASKAYYWQRVREAWGQPDNWVQTTGWNTDWINRLLAPSPASSAKPKAGSNAPPATRAPADANQ